MALLAATATSAQDLDPRAELLELRLAGQDQEFLAFASDLRHSEPNQYLELGIDLALGDLHRSQDKLHDAFDAYLRAIGAPQPVGDFALTRLAQVHFRLGQPDSAAELARKGLGRHSQWPASLISTLTQSVKVNGKCDALGIDPLWKLEQSERRRVALAGARCRLRQSVSPAVTELTALISSQGKDLVASEAADLLWPHRDRLTPTVRRTLAEVLHHHRRFEKSTVLLAQVLAQREDHDNRYRLARGYFWLGQYTAAAEGFSRAAKIAPAANLVARSWFQRGRSLELDRRLEAAGISFRRAYDANPSGSWADAALLSAMRLETMAENDTEALRLYRLLAGRRSWKTLADRAAIFLAASDLVRGNSNRAHSWLSRSSAPEFVYWKGRLAELEGRSAEAVDLYLSLAKDPFHPVAGWAQQRLREDLQPIAQTRANQLASSFQVADWQKAVFALDGDAQSTVIAKLDRQVRSAVGNLWNLSPTPARDWPLWTGTPSTGDELISLGIVTTGQATLSWFPLEDPSLTLAGIDLANLSGQYRSGLRTAEILKKKLRSRLSVAGASQSIGLRWLHQRLYPRPFLATVQQQASRFGVDENLLLGLIRQESRFDPDAVSQVSARGLTQFVVSTAETAAQRAGIRDLTQAMLHRPEVAITLGASHLSQLSEQFDAAVPAILAAYNAGEQQAQVWAEYCFSSDPAEYWSKVGFNQTRNYIVKVMTNQERYHSLYGPTIKPTVTN